MESKALTITPEIAAIVTQIANEYKNLISQTSVATGTLRDFTYGCEINGSTFEVYFNLPDYWKYVEVGRKAGKMPPIDAIKKWLIVKRLVPKPLSNGTIPTLDQTAYLIARSIGRNGIEGKHQLAEALDTPLIQQLEDLIINQLTEETENELS